MMVYISIVTFTEIQGIRKGWKAERQWAKQQILPTPPNSEDPIITRFTARRNSELKEVIRYLAKLPFQSSQIRLLLVLLQDEIPNERK